MIKKLLLLAFTLCVFTIFSCKREDARPSWDTEIITPLLKGSLSINDIVTDTLLVSNADSSLKLVYQTHLFDVTVDSLFSFFDTSVTKGFKLDSINLLNQSIIYPITLGDICKNAGILGLVIVSQNGNSIAIPAFGPFTSGLQQINADTLFQTMTLITGELEIKLVNGLPVDVTNVGFVLQNTTTADTITYGIFPVIPAGDSVTQTFPLDGKTINGNMTANLVNLSSPGSGGIPVLIDTSDALVASLSVKNLHPLSATAIFPAQNLVDKSQKTILKGLPVELKDTRVRSGQVRLIMSSTLEDSVKFTYELPSASINGAIFTITKTMPPAPPGGVSTYTETKDFAGYRIDLSGPLFDTVNTMFNTFKASIDSTGQMRHIELSDSFFAKISFLNIEPEYARGYLNQDTFTFGPEQVPIDLFNKIKADQFGIEDINLSISAENGIGIDGAVHLNQLQSINTSKGTTVTLSGSALANPLIIPRATDNSGQQPVNYTNTTLQLNTLNSNAKAFVENLPDQINYSIDLITNPGGNTNNWGDFIYYTDGIEFDLNLEIPLSLIAGNLTLTDTLDFAMNEVDLDQITGGTMTLIAQNGFPLDATIQLYLLNESGTVIDSLLSINKITAAPLGPNNKVINKKESRLLIPVTQTRIEELFICKKILLKARLDTKPANQYVKIYSNYSIDFQLTGDFNFLAD